MAPQFPSIESFFHRTSPPTTIRPSSPKAKPGDGFTDAELDAVLHPEIDTSWTPAQEYHEFDIIDLEPGPRCITVHGRIANFYDHTGSSRKPKSARGSIKLILKDDTGALTVHTFSAISFPQSSG
jgi:hypothetical protein